ncbi:DUF2206 domain-containing protein [Halobaculum sp. EA56]|uniref:DUF2206 domain-containing protein n=1 Tax=Halobaculum sp. EA56 TaxID=3421648 RepID=UPI003EBA369D
MIYSTTVPIIYLLYEKTTKNLSTTEICLSVFVYVFFYGFFKKMPGKHHIIQLFLAMLLIGMVVRPRTYEIRMRSIVSLIGIIITHYGLSLLIGLLFFGFNILENLYCSIKKKTRGQTVPIYILLITGFFSWYLYSASGLVLESLINLMIVKINGLFATSGSGSSRSGIAYILLDTPSFLWLLYKLINIIIIATATIGITSEVYRLMRTDGEPSTGIQFLFFTIPLFGITGISAVFYFGIGFDRIVQFSLLVLSLYSYIGLKEILDTVPEYWQVSRVLISPSLIFSVFLVLLLLLSSGVSFYLVGEAVPAYAVGMSDSREEWNVYNKAEIESAQWIDAHTSSPIGAVNRHGENLKDRDAVLLSGIIGPSKVTPVYNQQSLKDVDHLFLSKSQSHLIDVKKTRKNIVYNSSTVSIYY